MATGWYGRSVAAASLTRLPRGICCGVCGLTEPTPDSTEDGPADTAAAWATMTRHVLETHCTPCCVCGEAAATERPYQPVAICDTGSDYGLACSLDYDGFGPRECAVFSLHTMACRAP